LYGSESILHTAADNLNTVGVIPVLNIRINRNHSTSHEYGCAEQPYTTLSLGSQGSTMMRSHLVLNGSSEKLQHAEILWFAARGDV
jgi:hypothetical protein